MSDDDGLDDLQRGIDAGALLQRGRKFLGRSRAGVCTVVDCTQAHLVL